VTELSQRPEPSTRTVDPASVALLTIDTGSLAITSCNDAFAEVLDLEPDDVQGSLITDFVDDEVHPVATAVIEGIRAGFISSVDGNVDLLRRSGSIGVDCWILALGSDSPHNTAMAGGIAADGTTSQAEADPSGQGLRPAHIDPNRIVLATLDDDWRFVDFAPGARSQLGLPDPRAATAMPRLHDLVHPAHRSALDRSFDRRSSTVPGTLTVRLRGADGQWSAARVTVSPLRGQASPKFGLAVWLMPPDEPGDAESERLSLLEDQLARIREVVQADGSTATASVDLRDLTIRQREIVDRLLKGHRVDAIARDLYVSASTVRNHLSAIFEKLGVASQSELIELLRESSNGGGAPVDPYASS
jgi:DNA-binding CsgD family transcriptional regulator